MAQLSAVITTGDPDFRSTITTLLRSSGLSIGIIDEKHAGGTWPDLAVVDIRSGTLGAIEAIERLRASGRRRRSSPWPPRPSPIRSCGRCAPGANEYLAWPIGEPDVLAERRFQTALKRTVERSRPAKDSARSGVTLRSSAPRAAPARRRSPSTARSSIARLSKRPTLIIDLHQFVGEVALFLGVRPRFTLIDAHRQPAPHGPGVPARARRPAQVRPRHPGGRRSDRSPGRRTTRRRSSSCCSSSAVRTTSSSSTRAAVTGAVADVAVFAADTVYLVANPDIASVRNAHRIVDRFEQLGCRQGSPACAAQPHVRARTRSRRSRSRRTLGHSLHMTFPSDYSVVSAAMNSGVPLTLTNHSDLAARFERFTQADHQPAGAAGGRRAGPRDAHRSWGSFKPWLPHVTAKPPLTPGMRR